MLPTAYSFAFDAASLLAAAKNSGKGLNEKSVRGVNSDCASFRGALRLMGEPFSVPMQKPVTNKRRPSHSHAVPRLLLAAAVMWVFTAFAQDDSGFDIAGLQAIRGVVDRVGGGSIYVKVHSGTVYQVETGANTHFVKKGAAATGNPAHPGDSVLAGGELDQKKHTLGAVFVAVVDAEELAELDQRRAQWGKTWLAGTVTAKRGTELVIQRPDGVTNTVTVDEETSFRKQHQSITYPDVQVGDGMTATGVQDKSMFVAKVLTVVDAAQIREWSRI